MPGLRPALALGTLLALLALAVPAAPAAPLRGVAATPAEPFRVLVFSRTAGFRHLSIATGIETVTELGAAAGFEVDATEDPAQFTPKNLKGYDVVLFLNTTGTVLDTAGKASAAAVRPRRRRLRRHPLRRRHRARLALLRPPRRRLLPRPSARADRDDRQRGPDEPSDRASARGLPRLRRVLFVRREPAARRPGAALDRRVDLPRRPEHLEPARRDADDGLHGRPPDVVVPRQPRRQGLLHRARPRGLPLRLAWYREHILQGILLAAGRVEGDCTAKPDNEVAVRVAAERVVFGMQRTGVLPIECRAREQHGPCERQGRAAGAPRRRRRGADARPRRVRGEAGRTDAVELQVSKRSKRLIGAGKLAEARAPCSAPATAPATGSGCGLRSSSRSARTLTALGERRDDRLVEAVSHLRLGDRGVRKARQRRSQRLVALRARWRRRRSGRPARALEVLDRVADRDALLGRRSRGRACARRRRCPCLRRRGRGGRRGCGRRSRPSAPIAPLSRKRRSSWPRSRTSAFASSTSTLPRISSESSRPVCHGVCHSSRSPKCSNSRSGIPAASIFSAGVPFSSGVHSPVR